MDKPAEQYLVFNGNYLLQSNAVIKADNRAFLYGDGLFESFRVIKKKAWDIDVHFNRLFYGLEKLKIETASYFNVERIVQHIEQLIEKNEIYSDARVRLAVFRNPGLGYTPEDNQLSYLLTVENTPGEGFTLNPQGLAVDTYHDFKKQINALSSLKLINSQLYVLSGIDAVERGLDEALILNEKGNIVESTTSNIFTVNGNVIYTPALNEGCVAGTMRMHVINAAIDLGFKVFECGLTHQRLMNADEVFLTNGVKGIQWVNRYKSKRYFHKVADQLLEALNQQVEEQINLEKDPLEN